VTNAARALLVPERLVWIIGGPGATIESELRELGVEFEHFPPQ
jgi:hypothetical protein